jgi:DTW domain-containing protein
MTDVLPHAVARLRQARLAKAAKPFVARGSGQGRCEQCRLFMPQCLCDWRPQSQARSGVCLIMGDIEAIKPSNTGWLIADVVPDTFAFGWSRTEVEPALLALLADPQWAPVVVFPGEFVEAARVISELPPEWTAYPEVQTPRGPKPLFVLLDGTWTEARKMFRKSPYLDRWPVLSLQPEAASRYRLRRSYRAEHLCTAEVAALCLAMAGDTHAAHTLSAYFDVFTAHYLTGKGVQRLDLNDEAHQALRALAQA